MRHVHSLITGEDFSNECPRTKDEDHYGNGDDKFDDYSGKGSSLGGLRIPCSKLITNTDRYSCSKSEWYLQQTGS